MGKDIFVRIADLRANVLRPFLFGDMIPVITNIKASKLKMTDTVVAFFE